MAERLSASALRVVFADQQSCRALEEAGCACRRSFGNALAFAVVLVSRRPARRERLAEAACGVPGEAVCAVAGAVACRVVSVAFGNRPCRRQQAVTGRLDVVAEAAGI